MTALANKWGRGRGKFLQFGVVMSKKQLALACVSVLVVFVSWFFWKPNVSFRLQQLWNQWTIWASMPVGEPSLSMQGSLPLSFSVCSSYSHCFTSFSRLYLIFFPAPAKMYIIVHLFVHKWNNKNSYWIKNFDIYESLDWAGVYISWLIFTKNLSSIFIPFYKKKPSSENSDRIREMGF